MTDRIDEQPELRLPQRLADDLGRLYPPGPPVPQNVDEAILARARSHFARRRRIRLILGWTGAAGAAAAAIALVLLLRPGPQITPLAQMDERGRASSTGLAREDIDRNGRVDILDAFALARDVERGAVAGRALDLDGDGRVGRGDVDAVAMAAVRLERGSLQ